MLQITGHIFPVNMWSLDQRDWIFIEIMVHMNHRAQILRCQQVFVLFFFHMQSVDHHTLALSYLGKVRSWQRNKSHNEAIKKKEKRKGKKPQIPFEKKRRQNHHAATRAKINSCHVKSHKQDTKSCHAPFLHLRALGLLGLYAAAKKRKMADKAADLLCFALLAGKSCFDSA